MRITSSIGELPISYTDIRNRLRQTADDDKSRIEQIAAEVFDRLSLQLNTVLVPTTYTINYDTYDVWTGELPYGPIVTVDKLNGVALTADDYEVYDQRVWIKSLPATVTSVEYTAGYAEGQFPMRLRGLVLAAIEAAYYGADQITDARLKDSIRLHSRKSFVG